MLFRFMGKIPEGKLEFTCSCSAWNRVDYINSNCTSENPIVVTCTGCNKEVKFWQQKNHWHMDISEDVDGNSS